ncbi:MAG: hypothetical protein U0R44_04175 [Candidatus Micrarchaeia archaeon]
MRLLIAFLALSVLLSAGCTGNQPVKNDSKAPAANATPQPAPDGTPQAPTAPAPSPAPTGNPPAPQTECATMSPDCGSCIAKSGCGWCKTSNSCLSGDANGPVSGQCQPADWAMNGQECKAPTTTSGPTCAEQYNCAFCLSGSGCKWCIDGSRCVDASSADVCPNGLGWLTQSYQCNLASR